MNTRLAIGFAFFAWFAMGRLMFADQPLDPWPWMKTSQNREFLFKMVPEKILSETASSSRELTRSEINRLPKRAAFGVAYKLTENGDLEEMWRTNDWYAFEGYLSDDGRYFVRFGLWANDQENHQDLAIAFYDNGKLLKSYRVKELIKNIDALQYSVSHYRWRPEVQTTPNRLENGVFYLVMIDKTTYLFDIKTGGIITQGHDENAKSALDVLNGK